MSLGLYVLHVDLQILEATQMLLIFHAATSLHGAIHIFSIRLVPEHLRIRRSCVRQVETLALFFAIVATIHMHSILRLNVERLIEAATLLHYVPHFR